ncbi:MAG: APC family permease [Verrucomicrobia bacterium]|nr:APC family permease [Verrucomicrobiota bacterium]
MNALRTFFVGRARSLHEPGLFHKLSLVAVFAWVGLGADGLSSSCYGPEETFKTLGAHVHLSLFVALASVVTIVAICASYSQIIELFPAGGGGYLVASKLLSPAAGVVSGSALLVDYVLTITISVASGADALFSLVPAAWLEWKLAFAGLGIAGLTLLNLRGVRESVLLWVPVFFVFVGTHTFAIAYAIATHAGELGQVAAATAREVHTVSTGIGWLGLFALLLKAYSMGAGTYTGIEAVSNGLPILREPRVQTGRRTMLFMGISLAVTAAGLLVAYLLFRVAPVEGKTLNAVLLGKLTAAWPRGGDTFVFTALVSATALLFIAAQAGFLDGPRVLANMALDRWFPTRFANLSDRFVTQNGILLMGGAALLVLGLTRGSVGLLIVLYSINVFITFSLSQLGMVVHWWRARPTEPRWLRKLAINGFGLALTTFILVSLTIVKFHEGGWATLLVTGLVVAAAFAIKRHYRNVAAQLKRLDELLVSEVERVAPNALLWEGFYAPTSRGVNPLPPSNQRVEVNALHLDPSARTAVILVNGYNGLGLHTALHVPRLFGDTFKNYAFISVGTVDAGNFKGAADLAALRAHTTAAAERYAAWARAHGYGAATFVALGHDVMSEVMRLAAEARDRFPHSVFFAGQLAFTRETRLTRLLHNYTALALQRRFFAANLPFVVLPIRVGDTVERPTLNV